MTMPPPRHRSVVPVTSTPTDCFHRDDITIYNVDLLTTDAVADNSIDLIVTSPPYNVDIACNHHDDKLDYREYLEFSEK